LNRSIFLDAGGVILDEKKFEEASALIITKIISGYNQDYTLSDYWKDAEEGVYRFVPKIYDYVLFKNINDINDFKMAKEKYKKELKDKNLPFKLMVGIEEFLMRFFEDYKIGILGQYGGDFKDYLENQDILKYFTWSETQENYNITKPDPRYFEAILKTCNCKPEESIMIGDRIDKDIIPAKMLGMKTVRIKTGLHKNQKARTPEEIPDLTVSRLEEITPEKLDKMGNNNDLFILQH
jgi:HAD superfamily hydrolase (TIGR01549 family)